ncbi:MAG TPA: choline/ethanolamine kinase family protein [Gaiellaceae bacterium]|nr:choline/ethanolamine kinase family protein [Gaiellaceae bacterium]
MEAEEVAARIWPGREVRLEPLGGGITNHNFRVDVDGERLVLRIAGADTELLGIDREAERAAAEAAAQVGVGPEVVDFVEGCLVTRFVDGRPIPVEEMRRPGCLRETAALLRRVHEGPPYPARFDAFRVVEAYRETALEHGVELPPEYAAAKQRADEIERELGERPQQPCHNDLLNANFIRSADGIRIVDWEYAGMGDRFFDLANFSINHELDDEQNETLLEAYFGEVTDEHRRHLRLMRFMSDFREAMWGVVQQGISKLDFDYVDYAQKHFRRLEL